MSDSAPKRVRTEAPTVYGINVLLIDDQPIIGEAVRRLLANEEDIIYHYCSDPLKAVTEAMVCSPNIILQDLVMPDFDGLELLKLFREHPVTHNIPVIVLSTKEEPEIKRQVFELGANDYLVKLPDRIELIARIRLHARAYLNQLQRDTAMEALRQSEKQLLEMNASLLALNQELERANELITHLARHDPLTGLANRRVLDEELAKLWDFSVRKEHFFSVIMADLDHFKAINDVFGHSTGDLVLKAVGSVLASHMRSYDVAGRFGGEEFLILLPETPLNEAADIAERLRASIEALVIEGFDREITSSFGVAQLLPGEDTASLLDRADNALYSAKNNGRNRVNLANPST